MLDADESQRMRPFPFDFQAELNRFPASLEEFRDRPGMRMAALQIGHLRDVSARFILLNQYGKCLLTHCLSF